MSDGQNAYFLTAGVLFFVGALLVYAVWRNTWRREGRGVSALSARSSSNRSPVRTVLLRDKNHVHAAGVRRQNADPPAAASEALVRFLLRAFDAREIRTLVRRNYANALDSLPAEEKSLAHLAECTVESLRRARAIDSNFFDNMRELRPLRIDEIDQLEDDWLD